MTMAHFPSCRERIPVYYTVPAHPMEKDIFLEVDRMDGVDVPLESIVKTATRFAEEGAD